MFDRVLSTPDFINAISYPLNVNPTKMVKHSQTIRRLL